MAQGGNSDLSLYLRIKALVQGADSLEDLRREIEDLGQEAEDAQNPTDGFNDGLDRLDGSARKAGAGVKSTAGPLGEFKSLIADIALAALAKQVLDLNDQMTALRRGFDTITGSAADTTEALTFVREVADRLGVGVQDLAQSYLKLTAAAKGTQLEGAATEQIFSSLAGAMAVVGAGTQEVDQAMNAMAQIMSKGVVSAEELRGQLGDVLPGAAQQAAQSLLVTNAEFSKMLESGEIIASEFLPKFAAQLEKSLAGGAGRVESFAAAWARLKNQLTDLATGPIGAGFTSFVATLTEKLGVLARGAGFVVDGIGAVGTALGGLAAGQGTEALDDLGTSAENAALKLFGIKTAAEQAAETQKQMRAELAAIVPEMTRFQDAIARKDLKALPEYLQAAVAELRKTGDAAAATEQAVAKFVGSIEKDLNLQGVLKLAGALQAVGQEAKGAGGTIENTLAAALDKISDEQLVRLKAQAEAAMAAASQGSEEARRAFADLGLVIEAVAQQQLKRAAAAARDYASATGDYSSALERVAKAQISGLQAEIELARAKGETWTVQQKSVELAQLEARWAQTLAAAKQFEIQAQQQATQAKIAELTAIEDKTAAQQLELSGLQLKLQALGEEAKALQLLAGLDALRAQAAGQTNTQPIKEHTEAVRENSTALEENADTSDRAASSGGGLGAVLASQIQFWRDQTGALSEATRALFDFYAGFSRIDPRLGINTFGDISEEAKNAATEIDELTKYVRAMGDHFATSANDVSDLFARINAAGASAKKAYFEQKLAAEELEAQIIKTGNSGGASFGQITARMQYLENATQGAIGTFILLNEQDLDQLRSALDDANQKLQDMQEEAASAQDRIAELNAEIASEKGDTATADRLKLELELRQALAEVELNLAKARNEQNQELIGLYEEQKAKLQELYDLKERNLEQDQRQAKTAAGSNGNGSGSPAASGGAASGGSGVSITVNAGNAKLLDQNFVADLARQLQPELSRMARLSA
ncbi:MAG: tape measure protein [Candidatus Competibacteraceae bacterium]